MTVDRHQKIRIHQLFRQNRHLVIDDTDHTQSAIKDAVIDLLPELKKSGVTHFFLELNRNYQTEVEAFLSKSRKEKTDPATIMPHIPEDFIRVIEECKRLGIKPVLMDVPLKDPQAIAFYLGEHYNGTGEFPNDAPLGYRIQHEKGRQIFLQERDEANVEMAKLIGQYTRFKTASMIGSAHTDGAQDFEELLEQQPGLQGKVARIRAKPTTGITQSGLSEKGPALYTNDDLPDYDLMIDVSPLIQEATRDLTDIVIRDVMRVSNIPQLHGQEINTNVLPALVEARNMMDVGLFGSAYLKLHSATATLRESNAQSSASVSILKGLEAAQAFANTAQSNAVTVNQYELNKKAITFLDSRIETTDLVEFYRPAPDEIAIQQRLAKSPENAFTWVERAIESVEAINAIPSLSEKMDAHVLQLLKSARSDMGDNHFQLAASKITAAQSLLEKDEKGKEARRLVSSKLDIAGGYAFISAQPYDSALPEVWETVFDEMDFKTYHATSIDAPALNTLLYKSQPQKDQTPEVDTKALPATRSVPDSFLPSSTTSMNEPPAVSQSDTRYSNIAAPAKIKGNVPTEEIRRS